MTHAYPRGRWIASVLATDLVLAGVVLAAVIARPGGRLPLVLAAACVLVLVWGLVTLHFPSKVEIDDGGVTFHAYGRRHRFAWSDVSAVRVRRFLVRDRVLVRLVPSPPWCGRYWLLDSMHGFDALVRALESHGQS